MTANAPHPEDIKAALRKRHGTVLAFEDARALPRNSVRDVLRGRAVSRTALAIADELQTNVQDLFPGRFPSLKRDNSADASPAHGLNAEAR